MSKAYKIYSPQLYYTLPSLKVLYLNMKFLNHLHRAFFPIGTRRSLQRQNNMQRFKKTNNIDSGEQDTNVPRLEFVFQMRCHRFIFIDRQKNNQTYQHMNYHSYLPNPCSTLRVSHFDTKGTLSKICCTNLKLRENFQKAAVS